MARRRYKAEYLAEHAKRLDAETALADIQAHLDKLRPIGRRLSEEISQHTPALVPWKVRYHEWLALAVFAKSIERWGVQQLNEAPTFLPTRITIGPIPVVPIIET